MDLFTPRPLLFLLLAYGPPLRARSCEMDHTLVSLADTGRDYATFADRMQPYWDESFRYVPMYGVDASVGLRDWWEKEMRSCLLQAVSPLASSISKVGYS